MRLTATSSRRRGVTLVELMVVSAIMGLVSAGAASIMLIAARHTYATLDLKQTEERGRLVMEVLRKEILVGQQGTVRIAEDGNAITYFDPVRDITSGFAWDAESRELRYYLDFENDDDPQRTWQNIEEISFAVNPPEDFLVLGNRPTSDDTTNLVRVTVALRPRLHVNDDKGVRIENLVQVRNVL